MTDLPRRPHYTQRPEFVPPTMRPYGKERDLTYRVVSVRGPIGDQTFPNAQAALAWGHEVKPRGLWWVEAQMGVE